MATDRITSITVRYENHDGSEVLERVYTVDFNSAFVTETLPQGKIPGKIVVTGAVTSYIDVKYNNGDDK